MSSSAETILRKEKTMKFERSEIGALFSKLRTAVPEVRAVGNDSTGILLSGPDAFATNLELSIRAELSSPVPQGVVIPPRGVDFISGAVAPEININVTKSGLVIESGTARARLSTTPAENYPTFDGPGKDAKRCVVRANDLSWAVSKVLYAVSKEDRHPAHKGLCFSHNGDDTLEICALDGYRMAISRIDCTADGDFKFVLPAATAKAIDTLGLDGSVSIEKEAATAIAQHRKVSIRSGQGVGKTAFEANLVLWFLACFPYPRVVCTAPTRQQLNDVLWAEIAKWQERSPVLQAMLVWTKTRVYMRGHEKRWFAVARTATKPENMQGFHEDNMLFVVDEASGVADPIMEAIQGTLSGDNNRLLMCGNPTQNTGTFHDSHTVDAQSYYCMKVSSRDSPRTNKQNTLL